MNVFTLRDKLQYQPDKMAKVDLVSTPRLVTGLNCFEPGQVQKVHAHAGADKLYYVVEGSGEFSVGTEMRKLAVGDLLYVPESVEHGVANTGASRLAVLIVIAPNAHKK
jgi:mannose-6-phosphate isomerase-like protein (cupin superfamily)